MNELNKIQKVMILTDFKLVILAFVASVFVGCGTVEKAEGDTKNVEEVAVMEREKVSFSGKIQIHRPYCGGVKPTPEMAKGTDHPASNKVFYMYEGDRPEKAKDMIKITTDENGMFEVKLAPGNYHIIQEEKGWSLADFIKAKKVDDDFHKSAPDSCYEEWRMKPDFSVDIRSTMSQILTINYSCFSEDNPCLKYTGPYPP